MLKQVIANLHILVWDENRIAEQKKYFAELNFKFYWPISHSGEIICALIHSKIIVSYD